MNPELLINLRTILTKLMPDPDDIRRVMADALLDEARVKFTSTAVNHWHAVLKVAGDLNQMTALLVVIEREYPTNAELLAVCAACRRGIGQPIGGVLSQFASYPRRQATRPQPLINHDHAVALFQQLLDPHPPYQVLRLIGGGNMGKTTLLSKIFPALATQQDARWAGVDLRNPALSPPELLEALCQQLDPDLFPQFSAAYAALLAERLQNAQSDRPWYERATSHQLEPVDAEPREHQPYAHLTRSFVADLRTLRGATWLLLFDALEKANPATQSWLMDDLLTRLRPLSHVRVVAAGQSVPPAASSYAALCCDHELHPVTEVAAYIRYCRELGSTMPEPEIRTLAQNVGYLPGLFANIIKHFLPRERVYG